MEIDLITKLVQDYLDSRLLPNEKKEDSPVYFSYENQTLEIYTIYDIDIGEMKFPIAKAKRIKSRGIWKVYCMGRYMKWTPYNQQPEVKDIYEFLKLIDEDEHSLFWG
ncbi:DUF3024 domain-containing protein [Sinomicrobium weinanense]|uniref:DUF3024 domain-containing protein n=1 Tax=Sinomicrobium weinanense TaxID=2842200 RepID=A0A926Q464_9FLAO|nr:DUF3024 domain-containing protein [Sinomicrobium weinanense]MBC9798277.1 DUF3024 domain-containing protein [Sinomicrobium weinanense]MBU3125087.1 DUF3024 domain-containing protein [Sinomicrobium weinanense]